VKLKELSRSLLFRYANIYNTFYRAMLCRASLCHSKSSVRPSVRLWRSGMFFTQVGISLFQNFTAELIA